MNELPIVSVIILTYKKFEDFYKTTDSIIMQEYPLIELIISDDGSPNFDEEREKICEYINTKKRDNIIRIKINALPENVGTVKNANKAVALVTGKYIRFISPSDELIGENCLLEYVRFAEKNNAMIVAARTLAVPYGFEFAKIYKEPNLIYRFKARGSKLPIVFPTKKDIKKLSTMSDEKQKAVIMSRCIISTPATFYSKEVFTIYSCFLEEYRLLEDMPTWPHLAAKGIRFHFLDRVMAKYSLTGISNGGELNNEFFDEYCMVMKDVYIPNDARFGIFAPINRKLRSRYIDFLKTKNDNSSREARSLRMYLQYLDCFLAYLFLSLKYLLFNTKL